MDNDKAFDIELKHLALSHAPSPIVKCGDIVTTLWGDWKREHKVMIYSIGVDIVSLSGRRFRRDGETLQDYEREVSIMGVEHSYSALRLNKDGEPKEKYGIALTNFKTEEGQLWGKKHKDFNHHGLHFVRTEIPGEKRMLEK